MRCRSSIRHWTGQSSSPRSSASRSRPACQSGRVPCSSVTRCPSAPGGCEPSEAPTPLERRRAYAAAGEARLSGSGEPAGGAGDVRQLSVAALRRVRHSEILSAGALEKFAACPVQWLVESELQPEALEPTP